MPPASSSPLATSFRVGLALVWLIAFASLGVQVDGLYGPAGIQPVGAWKQAVWSGTDGDLLEIALRAPSLLWVLPSAWGPLLLCLVGALASLGLLLGRYAAWHNLAAWASYRSLTSAGGVFLSFQWDALLLETSLIACAVLPWGREARFAPPVAGWWALRILLFRVVFFSGVVKLTSGDPTWRDLSALTWHYETQPLPNVIGWAAHQLPWIVHAFSAFVMFLIEGPIALLLLGPRKVRIPASLATLALMGLLALTGSYGYFQILVAVLCLAALDDEALLRARQRLPWYRPAPSALPEAPRNLQVIGWIVVVLLIAASTLRGLPRYAGVSIPEALRPAEQLASTLRLGNTYGLFAVMTTSRPLPVLEARWGDGDWSEVQWRWQTSDPYRAPRQVAPHMPRVDWQVWFAGLSSCERNPWLVALMDRLLRGSDPVARLIGDPRLRTRPPDALRLVRYDYRMTPWGADTDDWWTRERIGPYCPAARTRQGWAGVR